MFEKAAAAAARHLLASGNLPLPPALVTLLSNAELDTSTLGHRDPVLAVVASDENVAGTGAKVVAERVTHVDNVESSRVALTASDDTCTTHVASTSDHDLRTSVELDVLEELVLLNAVLDSVTGTDERVRVADGAAVVCDNVRHTTCAERSLLDLKKLVAGLLGGDAVDNEAALDVVENAEVLAALLDADNVHETSGVAAVRADLAVNLDQALRSDGSHLAASQCVL